MPESCAGRIFGMVMFVAVVAVSAWLFVFYFGDRESLPAQLPQLPNASSIQDLLPDIELFHREDPFSTANPEDANKWRDDGAGLELTLINCLDERWSTSFEVAVSEWENGTPDSLTLKTEVGTPESECSAVDGVMKVCNGDYGETDWKGINTVLIESGWITTSSARMNDHFFIDGADENKRQYTMCHELGHGFGLPHTDEQFWNRDLGNCLDYTNNFAGNMSPDDFLYNFLADLYGTTDGLPRNNSTSTTTDAESGDRRKRHLRRSVDRGRELFSPVTDESRRNQLLARWNEIDWMVLNGFVGSESDGWRRLHRTEYGASHEIALDETYTVQVHMLMARN